MPISQAERWEENFRSLVAFGTCDVPTKSSPLGEWVNHQRRQHRKGKLSSDRKARLEEIGFAWNVRDAANEEAWEERFGELVEYKNEHGNCNVTCGDGQLGEWVRNQRARKGKLSEDRIQLLNGLGFKWALRRRRRAAASQVSGDESARAHGGGGGAKRDATNEEAWEEHFRSLVEFRDQHGHYDVPQRSGPLGMWVKNQRQQHRRGKLSSDRETRLEEIRFDWNGRDAANERFGEAWEERFGELVAYKKAQGHCNVRQNGSQLGGWVMHQRMNYKKGKLSEVRIRRLEELDFDWAPGRWPRAVASHVSDNEGAKVQGGGGGAWGNDKGADEAEARGAE